MPEIPIDLTPRKRDDGKLDLIGKDDAGGEYVARTCETGSFTAQDAEGLAFADRDRVTPSMLVQNVVAEQEKEKADRVLGQRVRTGFSLKERRRVPQEPLDI